jgi:hypothetical protein
MEKHGIPTRALVVTHRAATLLAYTFLKEITRIGPDLLG